jgi:hypothetical protein
MGIIDTAMKAMNSAHMASVYGTEAEQFGSAIPFILGGLERGEKVVYILDRHTREDIVEPLMKVRDVQGALDAHGIEFLTADETYIKGGRFHPDRMIALLDSFESEALAQGFSGIRGAGEMTWHSSKRPGSEELMQYEARLNQRYPASSMNLLCQYEESSFDTSLLMDAVRTHPRVVVRGEVCHNPYYVPPEEFLSGMKGVVSKDEFERTCKDILKRTRFSEIHRLELHDMRQVSRRMAVIGGLAVDDVQNQLEVLGFYTELALEAVQEPSAKEYLRKMEDTRACLQRRLDFMRSYQMVGEAEPGWRDLREVLERVYQRVSIDGIGMDLSVGGAQVYADGLLEKALEALVVNVPDMDGKGGKVAVRFTEVGDKGLLSIQHTGKGVPENFKNRIFECGYRYGHCEGFDLFLASEILRSTGMTVKETGVPGKCTRFEVCIPRGKYTFGGRAHA